MSTTEMRNMQLIDATRHGREESADQMRRRGLRSALAFEVGMRHGGQQATEQAKREGAEALRNLVDAFLSDRHGNRRLFERAHQVGRTFCDASLCWWTPGEQEYTLECPVFALHRVVAHSVAMTVTTACSLCDAPDFECMHVPGFEYDGRECSARVTGMSALGHIALTAEPDFVYTWHQPQSIPTTQLLKDGFISRGGDPLPCEHCQQCEGKATAEDLDPVERFRRKVAEGQAGERDSAHAT